MNRSAWIWIPMWLVLSPWPAAAADWPELLVENFEDGARRWQATDPAAWKVEEIGGGHAYSQFVRQSKYKPPHRSPYNISLVKDLVVGDFELTAKVKSTIPDYGHRDACLFFGYQDPAHFYYVHFGKQTDDHANQVFIVNDKPRSKISLTTTKGTPWTDGWHVVRLVRTIADGKIAVYFDDLEKPAMTAEDKTFGAGQVGIGSFDDTTLWDDVVIRGIRQQK